MTNKQHDDAWLDVMAYRIPKIQRDLYARNVFELTKEAHLNGWISEDDYKKSIKQLFDAENVKFDSFSD